MELDDNQGACLDEDSTWLNLIKVSHFPSKNRRKMERADGMFGFSCAALMCGDVAKPKQHVSRLQAIKRSRQAENTAVRRVRETLIRHSSHFNPTTPLLPQPCSANEGSWLQWHKPN